MRGRLCVSAWIAAVSCALLGAGPAMTQDAIAPSITLEAGCLPGEVIDGSTADDARRTIEAAGLTEIRDLKKGCDNFWHGKAMLSGRTVNVVLSPGGKVMLESE